MILFETDASITQEVGLTSDYLYLKTLAPLSSILVIKHSTRDLEYVYETRPSF